MQIKKLSVLLMSVSFWAFAACDTDVTHHIPAVDAPVLSASQPADGTTNLKAGTNTIKLTYDKNIFFASADVSKLTISGGEVISAEVVGTSNTLDIQVNLPQRGTSYTLTIPEGVVLGPNRMPAPAVSLQLGTSSLNGAVVNPSITAEAKKVFDFLLANYEKKTISGMMANVAWNTDQAEQVYKWTGKYPAMNCFDYVHLPSSSKGGWIDYTDITPVKEWWNNNGLVLAMWHWNVPKSYTRLSNSDNTPKEMPSDWSGTVQLTDEASKALFATAKVGDVIGVSVSNVADNAQGSFKTAADGWPAIADGTEYFDIKGDFRLPITDDVLTKLKNTGLIIGGHGYVVNSVGLYAGDEAGNIKYAFYKEGTDFDPDNALKEGTWENEIFTADLAKIAAHLKLLQAENIPVIWRPFHEAAGGWFWWGKNAESCKNMWIAMFDYFKKEQLNNLIWVWTAEANDAAWYPGDAYVDIVGRDIYGKTTAECLEAYKATVAAYGNKMIALSECGTVGRISEQWSAGARWSWFMPWYSAEGVKTPHADEAWWKDAMEQSYVITRDQLPSMK